MSTYLNLLRWVAASMVVGYHLKTMNFGPAWLNGRLPSNGQAYVMAFFVISGFVIAHTVMRKTLIEFAVDRAVRIYLVAIPVLAICLALSFLAPGASDGHDEAIHYPWSTLLLTLTFLSESWSVDVHPFLDIPYWSLAYEVMYYVIFAVWTYSRGWIRTVLLVLACGVAGPRVMLLFPCWLLGVAVYRLQSTINISRRTAWTVAILAPITLIVLFSLGVKGAANSLSERFVGAEYTHSAGFFRNWLVALAFAVHLWGVCQLDVKFPRTCRSRSTCCTFP
jgi:peptidoglycan/LPS O-acetylase OafA/YrhL